MGVEAPISPITSTHRNVATVSHAQYVPTLTAASAWRVKVAVSKGASLVTLTFDILTLKVVSESRVTWATSVPILAVGLQASQFST